MNRSKERIILFLLFFGAFVTILNWRNLILPPPTLEPPYAPTAVTHDIESLPEAGSHIEATSTPNYLPRISTGKTAVREKYGNEKVDMCLLERENLQAGYGSTLFCRMVLIQYDSQAPPAPPK